MSGIVGFRPPEQETVDTDTSEAMVSAIDHRGPDGEGTWSAESVSLGHQFLESTPEGSGEPRPFVRDDVVVTADVRLDNRDELFQALDIDKAPGSVSDGALLAAAYDEWREQCPEHLLGAFAFAIWDRRRNELFLARDHMGVKPLYYYDDGLFAFGSEIKALLAHPEVPNRLDETKVGDYLAKCFEDKERTFYEGVRRLPPAQALHVTSDGTDRWQYWELDGEKELDLHSDEEYEQRFREIFREAVNCRLRGTGRIGALLSGGFDSSSITCTARDLLTGSDRGLWTYSATFPDYPEADEREYVDAVVEQGGVEPTYVRADGTSPLADIEKVLWHEDEPFFASNLSTLWELFRAAADDQRVILGGFGGDQVLSHGLKRLTELVRAGRLPTFLSEARSVAAGTDLSLRYLLIRYGVAPFVPKTVREIRARGGTEFPSFIDDAFAEGIGLGERLNRIKGPPEVSFRTVRERQFDQLTSGLIPFSFEIENKAAAAFGMEPRYPFWDKRLVEFCVALPADQKLRSGVTRSIAHRALEGVLPDKIVTRTDKADLSRTFSDGLFQFNRSRLRTVANAPSAPLKQYIDEDVVAAKFNVFSENPHSDDTVDLWKILVFEIWLNQSNPQMEPSNYKARE